MNEGSGKQLEFQDVALKENKIIFKQPISNSLGKGSVLFIYMCHVRTCVVLGFKVQCV